jgi:hypothetical protein
MFLQIAHSPPCSQVHKPAPTRKLTTAIYMFRVHTRITNHLFCAAATSGKLKAISHMSPTINTIQRKDIHAGIRLKDHTTVTRMQPSNKKTHLQSDCSNKIERTNTFIELVSVCTEYFSDPLSFTARDPRSTVYTRVLHKYCAYVLYSLTKYCP